MKPLARRKFISLAALSGAGLASLSAQDQLARSAEGRATIGGAMEQHAAADGNRMTEESKKERTRRAMLAGPASSCQKAQANEHLSWPDLHAERRHPKKLHGPVRHHESRDSHRSALDDSLAL